jgi:selenocysteine lyase/cysteine desulfurase
VLELAGYCISGMKEHGINVITPEEPEQRLGVIASYVEEAQELVDFLRGRGVDTFAASIPTWFKSEGGRGDLFRVDPHIFNNREDVDRLLDGLGAYRR